MDHTALYRQFDKNNNLLYVGISNDPGETRLNYHLKKKSWKLEISHVTVEWFSTRDEASAHETYAIKNECPKYNIMHNKKSRFSNPFKDAEKKAKEMIVDAASTSPNTHMGILIHDFEQFFEKGGRCYFKLPCGEKIYWIETSTVDNLTVSLVSMIYVLDEYKVTKTWFEDSLTINEHSKWVPMLFRLSAFMQATFHLKKGTKVIVCGETFDCGLHEKYVDYLDNQQLKMAA